MPKDKHIWTDLTSNLVANIVRSAKNLVGWSSARWVTSSATKKQKKNLFCTELIQGSIKIRSAGSGLDPRPLGGGRGLFASGTLILFVCSSGGSVARRLLLHVPRHRGNPIDKLGLEEDVGIVEHPILQRHHDKLGAEKERDGIRTGWVRGQFYC